MQRNQPVSSRSAIPKRERLASREREYTSQNLRGTKSGSRLPPLYCGTRQTFRGHLTPSELDYCPSPCSWQCAKTPPCSGFWMQGILIFVRPSRNFTEPTGFQSPNHSSFSLVWQHETLGVTRLLNG